LRPEDFSGGPARHHRPPPRKAKGAWGECFGASHFSHPWGAPRSRGHEARGRKCAPAWAEFTNSSLRGPGVQSPTPTHPAREKRGRQRGVGGGPRVGGTAPGRGRGHTGAGARGGFQEGGSHPSTGRWPAGGGNTCWGGPNAGRNPRARGFRGGGGTTVGPGGCTHRFRRSRGGGLLTTRVGAPGLVVGGQQEIPGGFCPIPPPPRHPGGPRRQYRGDFPFRRRRPKGPRPPSGGKRRKKPRLVLGPAMHPGDCRTPSVQKRGDLGGGSGRLGRPPHRSARLLAPQDPALPPPGSR